MRYRNLQAGTLAAGILAVVAALATTQTHAQSAKADSGLQLDEVVVTAQKRAERLQDVPISITAVASEELDSRHIQGLSDMAGVAPNVFFRANPGDALISTIGIRGEVSGQPAIWADPPAGVYLDGVYLGKSQGQVMDLVDLERIEVLRGPQGTLFGRNTEAGAISFVSKKPTGEFDGEASLELGQYNHRLARLKLDLPRIGILSSSIILRKEQQDGWARNLAGPAMGAIDHDGVRLALKLDINDQLTADYAFDYSNADDTPNPTNIIGLSGWAGTASQYYSYAYYAPTYAGLYPAILAGFQANPALQGLPAAQVAALAQNYTANLAYNGGPVAPGVTLPPYGQIGAAAGAGITSAITPYCCVTRRPSVVNEGSSDGTMYSRSKNISNMLTFDYHLNDSNELKYIFAHRQAHPNDQQSLSGGDLATLQAFYNRNTHYDQTSNELQWIGNAAGGFGSVKWVGGLYYFTDDGNTSGNQDFGLLGSPPTNDDYGTHTSSKAAFAQIDYTFLPDWTLTGGARYTNESKSGWTHRYLTNGFGGSLKCDVPAANCAGVIPYTAYGASFSKTTPMGSLAWKVNENLNLYARVAKGFKSGGFSSELTSPAAVVKPFLPETSLLTELGLKSSFWGGRVHLNADVFHTKLTDQQITSLLPGTTQSFISNAGSSTYQGFELEAAVLVAEGWKVQLNYGYLDAKFDSYLTNPVMHVACPASIPNCAFNGLYTNNSLTTVDAASNLQPPYAPKNTVDLNLDGRLLKTRNGQLRLVLDWSYVDSTLLYAANNSLTAANAGGQYLVSLDQISAITNLNARLLFSDVEVSGGVADFSLYVSNALDYNKPIQGIDFGFYRTANWENPRTWMVTASYKFGGPHSK